MGTYQRRRIQTVEVEFSVVAIAREVNQIRLCLYYGIFITLHVI